MSILSLSFIFPLWSARLVKFTWWHVLFSCYLTLGLGLLRGLFVSQNHREFYASGLCICHSIIWSNLNFLHNSQWINFSTKTFVDLYTFCVCLLHGFIMWLINSSPPLKLHKLFCCEYFLNNNMFICNNTHTRTHTHTHTHTHINIYIYIYNMYTYINNICII